MTTPKGGTRGGGKPGNRNTIHGPRLGRHEKSATSKVAAQPLPSPKPTAKLPRRRRHTKTGGKDFGPGQNSHDGTVFRRTEDQLPRGNGTLMLKIAYHIYDSLGRLVATPTGALAFMDRYIDRTEGRPVKKIEKTERRAPTFVFTTKDGVETPALPEKVGSGATPAAASAEDAMILGLQPIRL